MSAPTASQARIDRELVRRLGFGEFARRAWPHAEASKLVWSWHIDAIVEHLEALARREIRDLAMFLPPGLSKSRFASVLFPSWVWTFDHGRRFMCASYSDKVVLRDARAMRNLCAGGWYQARWPEVRFPRDDSASTAAALYSNSAGGFRKSETVRGQWTGEHGDDVLVDDPLDPQGAASSAELDLVLEWWTGTMPTRYRDHTTSTRMLVMQRLHERDLGKEFKRAGATVLCLPMRFDSEHPDRWPRDPRRERGELICPQRVPEAEVQRMERTLGPARAAAQLQQRPSPAGGGVFRAEWFKRWTSLPPGGTWSMSIDCTFKVTTDGSYVVIQVWYVVGANHYLVDQRRERMSFTETLAAIIAMEARYPRARRKLIEAKANGNAVVDVLHAKVQGLTLVEPEGGKEARANGAQPVVAAGNVYLPDEERAAYEDGRRGAPWVPGLLHEAVTFPKGESDDQVDAMTQHINATAGSFLARLKAAFAPQQGQTP